LQVKQALPFEQVAHDASHNKQVVPLSQEPALHDKQPDSIGLQVAQLSSAAVLHNSPLETKQ